MATVASIEKPTTEQLMAEVTKLRAQLADSSRLRLKVSEKGAISVLGLQGFPVTLYASQWEKVIAFAGEITKFIAENESKLSRK